MAEACEFEKASSLKADSIKEGDVFGADAEYAGESSAAHHGELKRNFKPRHMAMISLGGCLGSGVFVSSGKALRYGSFPGFLIGWVLIALSMILALRVLSEASILFPTSGSFIDHASRFVDPALGFACGFCLWLAWTVSVASEGAIFSIVISYWTDAIPVPVLMTIYLLVIFFIHAMPNTWFGEFEFVVSTLKVGVLLLLIFAMIAFLAGAGPTGTTHHYQNFTELDAFPNGYKGIVQSMILAAWAIAGLELIGITNGEATSPRVSLPRAQGLLMTRIIVLLTPAFAFILMLVPYTSDSLLGTSNAASSPFVVAMNQAGLVRGLPDLINAIIVISLFAIGAEALYLSSRIATAMARMHMFPAFMGRVDKAGRPIWSLATGATIGLVLTYVDCSSGGAVLFTWLSSLTSIVFLIDPIVVGVTNLRMRRALALQNDPGLVGRYAYTVRWWPAEPVLLILLMSFCLVSALYLAVDPIDGSGGSAESFFELFLTAPIFVAAFLGYKLWFRTKLVDLSKADLVSGRRAVSEADMATLDAYNALPLWKRVLSYLKMN
ncbi:AAT family amino acid transporter [Phyllosticta capitalensis]